MANYQGKNVKTRPLTKDDPKMGNQFKEGEDKVVVTYDDGREEVVAKSAVAQ